MNSLFTFRKIYLAFLFICATFFSSKAQNVPCGGQTQYSFSNVCSINWTITLPDGSVYTANNVSNITVSWGNVPGTGIVTASGWCGNFPIEPFYRQVTVGNGRAQKPKLIVPNHICNNQTKTITAGASSGSSSYTFEVPNGWKINGASVTSLTTTSNTVQVTAPATNAGTGVVQVKANGAACYLDSYYSERSIAYGVQTPSLTGPSTVQNGAPGHFFSDDYGYSNITWDYPSAWDVVGFDNSFVIDFAVLGNPGTYQVQFNGNLCGTPLSKSMNVTVIGDDTGGVVFIPEFGKSNEATKQESLEDEVNVYPNPSNGVFSVEMPHSEKPYQLSVYDLTGKEVYSDQTNGGLVRTDVSHLSEGSYLLILNGENGKTTKRITVKK